MDLDLLAPTSSQDFDFFNFDVDGIVSERMKLLANLPWFQLQDILVERSKYVRCVLNS